MTAYRFLTYIFALPVLIALIWRVLRRSESWVHLRQRLGRGAAVEGALWLHAASNGELTSARALIETLLAENPERRVLVTTNTVSAQDLAVGWGDPRIIARLAPLDHALVLRGFLRRHKPHALLIVENELWPNRIALARRRGIPVIVIGARMSQRSAARWAKLSLARQIMTQITAVSAQDAESEARFVELGLAESRLLPRINLKTAPQAGSAAPLGWPRASTILAASTHEGEDAPVLDAFARAHAARPELRLILAPRHPRRGPEIATLIARAGLRHATRSMGDPPDVEVYLADTLGEMDNWYASAGLCFIGGSLVDKGGHTPFEPAAHHCAILHGPYVSNFTAAFGALDAQGGAILCRNAAGLAEAMRDLGVAEQTQMAQAARDALGPPENLERLTEAMRRWL